MKSKELFEEKGMLETCREHSILGTIENSEDSFVKELGLHNLISNFSFSLKKTFSSEINNETRKTFLDILKHSIQRVKTEQDLAENLNNQDYYVWHLSIFMTLQTFMKIVNSKYRLKQKDKIVSLFDELLETKFDEFLALNSRRAKKQGEESGKPPRLESLDEV